MALRIREWGAGEIVCAVKSEVRATDQYVGDELHYKLSVVYKAIEPDPDEAVTGRWHWKESESVEHYVGSVIQIPAEYDPPEPY